MVKELLTKFSDLSKEELEKELADRQKRIFCAEVVDLDDLYDEIEVIEYCLNNIESRE